MGGNQVPQQQQQPIGYPTPPPSQQTLPTGPSGGYTLPPTVAYFPVTAYTNSSMDPKSQDMLSQESLNQLQQQPNTPDLLMHRRQVMHHDTHYYTAQ